MKGIRIFFRSISESMTNVGRNLSLSVASISCISITLILVAVSIILSQNVNSFTASIEKDVTIVVFIDREATEEDVKKVGIQINSLDNIESVKFQSKNETKKQMQADSEVFKSIMESYDEETNPLQDTYLVKVDDINFIGDTAKKIKEFDKVAVVKYGEGMVEELVKIFDIVKKITYIVVIALVVVTAFLISNTIKITITNRRREIEIMRLVGASNSYIKLPFFFEGLWLGFIGSIVPIFACCYGYLYLYNRLGGQLFTAIIKLVKPDALVFNVVLSILAVGVLVGAFGSYRAVRRYLKI
jgi:cell division transport system permease protein